MFVLEIFGEPVAQGRPRFSSQSGFVRAYDPAKSRDYKQLVRVMAQEQMRSREVMEGPLHLVVHVLRTPPKSWSKRKTQEAIEAGYGVTTKPDLDNYIKLVSDALNTVVFRDDSQIVRISASKRYSKTPGLVVEVTEDKR